MFKSICLISAFLANLALFALTGDAVWICAAILIRLEMFAAPPPDDDE
jgi:hypothetical protein